MDIKDSYLHGTVGVVKSISVSADKLKYILADIAGTVREVTLPVATLTANGLLSKEDKKKLDNMIATKVANDLILKINSGTTEGTSLYTYNGSATKTLDIKLGSNVTLTAESNSLTIAASDTKVTQTNTTGDASYRVLFSGNANDTTETTTARKSANLLFNPNTGKLTVGHLSTGGDIIFTGTNKDQYLYYYHKDAWAWRTGHQGTGNSSTNYYVIQSLINGTVTTGLKIDYDTSVKATFGGTVIAPTFQGNLDGTYVNKLTGYAKATAAADLATTDTLNTALGKLEYKAHYAYNWVIGVTASDTDEYINKWGEIVGFLDSVKEGTDILDEFVTRKTALTITGLKTFQSESSTTGVSLILKNNGWAGGMSTAMDFYNGRSYAVPNARISTAMNGDGKAGGTLIFYTLTKHASTNPNPNGLTERLRIDDNGLTKITGSLTVTSNITGAKFITSGGTSSLFVKGDGSLDSNTYLTTTGADNNFVKYSKITMAEINKTNHNPFIFNVESETLISGYGQYWYLLNFGSYSGGGYRTQLAMPYYQGIKDTDLFIRSASGDSWRTWRRVLHEGNYTSYVNSTNFPGLAGVRSTTINGNYLRVNTNGTNADLTIPYATKATSLKHTSLTTGLDLNTLTTEGVYSHTQTPVCNSLVNGPTGRSNGECRLEVINCGSSSHSLQWLYTKAGKQGEIWYRMGTSDSTWSTWNKIAFISNIPTSLKNPYTLTFSTGTFAAKTYDGSAAVTVNVPTKTSHLTNDSGYLTSRGYIGTTAVQASSAALALTGITNLTMSGNLTITPGNTDNFINFSYNGGSTYSWRLGYLGTGSGDTNYFVVQSAKAAGTSWNNVIRLGNETLDAAFGGNVYPLVNNTQTLGTSSLRWSNIYSVSGNYSGNITLYTSDGGDSPHLVFLRGTTSDGSYDWRIYDTGGYLKFQYCNADVWTEILSLYSNGITSTAFIKSGSSDSYVLLGGGGHKTISSLSVASANKLTSTVIISAKAFSLSNASWTDTSYTFASLASGTYAVQVTSGSNLVASGIMSVYKNLADTAGDEIPLHVYGTAGWRPYLRTYNNKLLISSNDASATSRTVTIKIALIL